MYSRSSPGETLWYPDSYWDEDLPARNDVHEVYRVGSLLFYPREGYWWDLFCSQEYSEHQESEQILWSSPGKYD